MYRILLFAFNSLYAGTVYSKTLSWLYLHLKCLLSMIFSLPQTISWLRFIMYIITLLPGLLYWDSLLPVFTVCPSLFGDSLLPYYCILRLHIFHLEFCLNFAARRTSWFTPQRANFVFYDSSARAPYSSFRFASDHFRCTPRLHPVPHLLRSTPFVSI